LVKRIIAVILLLLLLYGGYKYQIVERGDLTANEQAYSEGVRGMHDILMSRAKSNLSVYLEDRCIDAFGFRVYLNDSFEIIAASDFLEDIVGCSVLRYPNGEIRVERNDSEAVFKEGKKEASVNGKKLELSDEVYCDTSGIAYLPVGTFLSEMSFSAEYDVEKTRVTFHRIDDKSALPAKYDMRKKGRLTEVRDQGKYGTCWAFASLSALESSLMPYEKNVFSVDHMSLNNSFHRTLKDGGEHTISIAYLAAWQGPVYEKDDPYGDGETNGNLKAVKHLEEAIIINDRDDTVIKSAIYKYGGVETSLYMGLEYVGDISNYYNEEKCSYYCDEVKTENHDIVIVGWDDNYPKENFTIQPHSNGAFICKNSWGTEFGEEGYFYVSYEDENLCRQSIVYTRIAENDNFDNIYQSDTIGWVGQMGFGVTSAYFANCYTAKKDEVLRAVSFYATAPDTEFSVYLVHDFKEVESLKEREFLVSGRTRYSGYYTVRVPEGFELQKGEKYAVVVSVSTPSNTNPIAVEYSIPERDIEVDLSDGEGYISLYGEGWHSAEEAGCNVCLKAFTDDK